MDTLEFPNGGQEASTVKSTKDEPNPFGEMPKKRTGIIVSHLSGLLYLCFPLGNILGPLIVWLSYRDSNEEIKLHSRASLNFQLTISLIGFLISSMILLLVVTGGLVFGEIFEGSLTIDKVVKLAFSWGGVLLLGLTLMIVFVYQFLMVVSNTLRGYDGVAPKYWPVINFVK